MVYVLYHINEVFDLIESHLGLELNIQTYLMYDFKEIILASLGVLIISFPVGTIIKRIKCKTLFTNTIIYSICLLIDSAINHSTKNKNIYDQIKARMITLFILALIPILGWIIFAVLATKWNFRISYDLELLKNGTNKIKSGDYDVSFDGLHTNVSKEIATNLNEVKNNINNIVDEKVKDEKSKIKLILDASYDLKNPLESIIENINY